MTETVNVKRTTNQKGTRHDLASHCAFDSVVGMTGGLAAPERRRAQKQNVVTDHATGNRIGDQKVVMPMKRHQPAGQASQGGELGRRLAL